MRNGLLACATQPSGVSYCNLGGAAPGAEVLLMGPLLGFEPATAPSETRAPA